MMTDITSWWESLQSLEQIYWGFAVPFTFFFLIQLVLTFFGGDIPHDSSVDVDINSDDGIGFQFFTVKNLVAFFTIFSWAGIACLDSGLSNSLSILISVLAGLAMMLIMGGMFYFMDKADSSGTLKMKNAIGMVGEVYMEVKATRGNIGQIQVKVQGTLRTLDAVTDDEQDLKSGSVVTVSELVNDNLLIVTKNKL